MANSVDPDQTVPLWEQSDKGLNSVSSKCACGKFLAHLSRQAHKVSL